MSWDLFSKQFKGNKFDEDETCIQINPISGGGAFNGRPDNWTNHVIYEQFWNHHSGEVSGVMAGICSSVKGQH